MMNKIISVIIGSVILLGIIYGCETMVEKMNPSPSGSDYEQAHVLTKIMYQFPRGTFAGLFMGYILASVIGGVISTLISGREEIIPAAITGVIAMVVGIVNPYEAPHPAWFTVASLLSFIPFACLGYFLVRKPPVKRIYESDYSV